MPGQQKTQDPFAKLAAEISDIRRIAEEALRRPTTIPVLDEDPPEDSAVNVWFLQDGRLRARYRDTSGTGTVIREFEPVALPGTGTSGDPTPDPVYVPETRQDTWTATWTATYRGAGPMRTDKPGLVGSGSSGDSFSGKMSGLIGFDWGAIQTALSGGVVNNVWIILSNDRTYWNDGATLVFGGHNFGSAPGSWNGTGLPVNMAGQGHIGSKQAEATIQIPLSIAAGLRDGSVKGVALQAPSSDRQYYQYSRGVPSSAPPRIVINYTK